MDATQPILDIYSLGKMSADARWPVSRVKGTLDALGLKPVAKINGLEHYSVDSFVQIMRIAYHEDKQAGLIPEVSQ